MVKNKIKGEENQSLWKELIPYFLPWVKVVGKKYIFKRFFVVFQYFKNGKKFICAIDI